MVVSREDREAIRVAVAAAEKTTAVEIVPVLARASDDYAGARWRLAVALGLAFAAALGLVGVVSSWFWALVAWTIALGAGHLLALRTEILGRFVTREERETEVAQRAAQTFLDLGLHGTAAKPGVLLFVSLLERRIEVLCDTRLRGAIPQSQLEAVVDGLAQGLAAGSVGSAMSRAITELGACLAVVAPSGAAQPSAISDDLVEL